MQALSFRLPDLLIVLLVTLLPLILIGEREHTHILIVLVGFHFLNIKQSTGQRTMKEGNGGGH